MTQSNELDTGDFRDIDEAIFLFGDDICPWCYGELDDSGRCRGCRDNG